MPGYCVWRQIPQLRVVNASVVRWLSLSSLGRILLTTHRIRWMLLPMMSADAHFCVVSNLVPGSRLLPPARVLLVRVQLRFLLGRMVHGVGARRKPLIAGDIIKDILLEVLNDLGLLLVFILELFYEILKLLNFNMLIRKVNIFLLNVYLKALDIFSLVLDHLCFLALAIVKAWWILQL